MLTLEGKVLAPTGLTARLSTLLVAEANKYNSSLTIKVDDEEADLKSIMNVMALVIPHGTKFVITIDGTDQDKALAQFEKLLKDINLM